MCSPTRAALLTGVNPHRAGAGHVANSDPGFPGYAAELADDVATAAEVFRDAGYHTMAIGKWHLTKDSDLSDAGPAALVAAASGASTATTACSTRSRTSTTPTGSSRTTTRSRSTSTPTATTSPTT